MKLSYPAEAFALGILLFSAGMKEAFAAGILVILAVTFAEFLKNLLKNSLPVWSLRLCVFMGTGALCASAFVTGFAALGIRLSVALWVMCGVIGLLCARHALFSTAGSLYGQRLYESAFAWGFWTLLAAAREFLSSGTLFENAVRQASFQSKAFGESAFAFLLAGLTLAFTNGVLRKSCRGLNSLFVFLPAALFIRLSAADSVGQIVGTLWAILLPTALFLSVKRTLRFSRTSNAYRGLPVDMLAAGFIYMIVSVY